MRVLRGGEEEPGDILYRIFTMYEVAAHAPAILTTHMFNWVLSVIESGGYAGIFFLMVLENIFPPIPSEVILPVAGFAAASGDLHIIAVVLVAACGAVIGHFPWYMLGRLFSSSRLKRLSARYGRLLAFSPRDIDRAQEWFARHGRKAILFGRLVPTVRTLISIPAGSARMPLATFLLYSFIGSAAWTAALVLSGYVLESQYEKVTKYIDLAADGVILRIVVIYVYRVITFRTEEVGREE
ncbi:MAG: DedA family protein [Patescibacteria group bacterium]|nr:DedA family protein [Patescibacteria group bacterium]